ALISRQLIKQTFTKMQKDVLEAEESESDDRFDYLIN
ncbi:unnamed protein product, partial [Adineta steineri]